MHTTEHATKSTAFNERRLILGTGTFVIASVPSFPSPLKKLV